MNVLILNRWPLDEVPYHEWASDHNLLLVTTNDVVKATPRRVLEQYSAISEIEDFNCSSLVELEARRLHVQRPVDLVIALSEWDLLTASRLRRSWNITGQSVASTLAFRDKFVMKSILAESEVPVAEFARVDYPSDLIEFIDQHGLPVIVKPRLGASSKGITVLKERLDVDHLLRFTGMAEGDSPANLMVEVFVQNEMYQVNGAIDGGELVFSWPADTTSGLGFEQGLALKACTLPTGDPLVPALRELAEVAVRALGAPNIGLIHAEIFRTPQGELLFNEVGCRIGGAMVREVYFLAFGVDLVEWFVRRCLDSTAPSLPTSRPPRQAGYALVPPARGKVCYMPERCPTPGVKFFIPGAAAGDLIGAAASSNDAIASFAAEGTNPNEVYAALDEAVTWFRTSARMEIERSSLQAAAGITAVAKQEDDDSSRPRG